VTRRDEEVALADDGEVLCTFPVVDDAASISVRLSAIVENMSRSGEEQTLQASDCFVLNDMDTSAQVEDIYLRWNAADMQLMVVGKTGEWAPTAWTRQGCREREASRRGGGGVHKLI
jgi:hypothetical protein